MRAASCRRKSCAQSRLKAADLLVLEDMTSHKRSRGNVVKDEVDIRDAWLIFRTARRIGPGLKLCR
jgi:hypothetical protein